MFTASESVPGVGSSAEGRGPDVKPLFSFSFTVYYALAAVSVLIFGPLAVLFVSSAGSSQGAAVTTILFVWVTALSIDLILFLWQQRVRRFQFYEYHFKLEGRGTKIESDYSSISRVECVKSGLSRNGIRVTIRGQDKPILIPANPKNAELNTDLCSWLTGKVGNGPSEAQ